MKSSPIAMRNIKNTLRDWLPPAILRIIQKILMNRHQIKFHGDYQTWKQAEDDSCGYNQDVILEKVKIATLKVKNGEAMYERDSVLFDHIQYSWSILAGLMWAASQNQGRLDVIDFGGSLGSTYFQNRKFLAPLPEVHWNIIEQSNFVTCGQNFIQDDHLHFYSTVCECLIHRSPNVVLLSGVLPYVEDWITTLKDLLEKRIPIVLVDRTYFVLDGDEKIAVQIVPESIYTASYPCRFLNKEKFIQIFNEAGYELVEEFPTLDRFTIPLLHRGFIFSMN